MNATTKSRLGEAETILIANGINKDDAPTVLRSIGFALLERDIYSKELENRQDIARAMRDALLLTSNAGSDRANALRDLKYDPKTEIIRPIFEDGTGSSGCYDINVCADSGTAVIIDIVKQFVRPMW